MKSMKSMKSLKGMKTIFSKARIKALPVRTSLILGFVASESSQFSWFSAFAGFQMGHFSWKAPGFWRGWVMCGRVMSRKSELLP